MTISKFISGAKEIEFDAVAQSGKIMISAIAEHIENAGVHSGDATIVYPPQKVYAKTAHEIQTIAEKLALALRVTGPFNLQCLVKDNKVYVIEMNIRASRTFPFISKATGVNFAEMIVDAFYGRARAVSLSYPEYAVVKSPQFSFGRLPGADPVLYVEMSSTGEVACFGHDFEEALLSSIAASTSLDGNNGSASSPQESAFISLGNPLNKKKFLESAESLAAAGFTLYATKGTSKFLNDHGLTTNRVYKVSEKKNPNAFLFIAGPDAGWEEHCKELARKLGLKNYIFAGNAPHEHVQEYYSLSDVFVLPSRFLYEDNIVNDSWGLMVNEALSLGIPVVGTTAVAAAYDMIENGVSGYQVPQQNIPALAVAIEKSLANKPTGARKAFEHWNNYNTMFTAFKKAITLVMRK